MIIPRVVPPRCHGVMAEIVQLWGYRKIEREEMGESCTWIRDDNYSGIIWLVPAPVPDAVVLHGIGNPSHKFSGKRRFYLDEQVMLVIRVAAGCMGANRVYTQSPLQDRAHLRYLRMRGFCDPDARWPILGPYLEV